MRLRIDGKRLEAREGQTLLAVARENGIAIPTLCYHAGVEAWGGCRLCMVELSRPEWPGWSRLVTACVYPAEEGLHVDTKSPAVIEARRLVLDLLLARCPTSDVIRELAESYGIGESSYEPRKSPDVCILCGLCVRVCAAVGAHAIATAGRGVDKRVATPYGEPAMACIGCLSCATNCPTGAIPYGQDARSRTIWGRTFDLVHCDACGAVLGTKAQLKHLAVKSGLPGTYFSRCDNCRKRDTADIFRRVMV